MMNPASPTSPFAAFVGIDWADAEHAVSLREATSAPPESSTLPQTPEAIDAWATQLRSRFGGRPVAICLEQSRGALIYALLKYDFFVLYPINPKQLARYREAIAPSGAKDDPDDAALLLDFLVRYRDRLRPWKPDDVQTRLIGLLGEDRRQAIQLRTQLSNRLRDRLKLYFPQALELVGDDVSTRMAGDFLLKWPTLEALQRAKPEAVRRFYLDHHCRKTELIERRLAIIAQARPLTTDPAVIQSASMQVRLLATQLLALVDAIDEYDDQLAQLFSAHPDAEIFTSLPGAGAAMAPRLLAAFGTDRSRIESARHMQDFSGIAPVTKRSGKSLLVHRRFACPKFLRQTFHEFAGLSIAFSSWAKAYYELQRSRGKGHHATVRALAFKWIRIIYRCWQTRTRYDESRYLQALRAKTSPLLRYLAA